MNMSILLSELFFYMPTMIECHVIWYRFVCLIIGHPDRHILYHFPNMCFIIFWLQMVILGWV